MTDHIIFGLIVLWSVFGVLYLLFMQKASDRRFEDHPIVKKGANDIRELRKKWGRGENQ